MENIPKKLIIICLIMTVAVVTIMNFSVGDRDDHISAITRATPTADDPGLTKEARFYEALDDNYVQCQLCFRECEIADGQKGFCGSRKNEEGVLYSLVYGVPSAVHIDPIEKEPQHHFLPGTQILCLGTAGCNFRWKFCHNWHLSQRTLEEIGYFHDLPPEEVIEIAKARNVPSISFTYNEPTVFYEYMYDVAEAAQKEDINVVFHSNASMNPEPLRKLMEHVDSVTIDLKGFNQHYYRSISQGDLNVVLENLKIIRESGAWLEVVNLVVPTLNDDPEEIRQMARWIKENLGAHTPLHFSRFSPSYQLTSLSPTPVDTLEKARDIALEEGLLFISIGNVPGHTHNSTFCPECNEMLIDRHHFTVRAVNIENGSCTSCGYDVPGVWE